MSPSFFRILAEDAGGGRGEFHRGFVGFQFDDVFVERDGVAFLLQPAADLDFADGFADFGDFQFDTHQRWLCKRSGDQFFVFAIVGGVGAGGRAGRGRAGHDGKRIAVERRWQKRFFQNGQAPMFSGSS